MQLSRWSAHCYKPSRPSRRCKAYNVVKKLKFQSPLRSEEATQG